MMSLKSKEVSSGITLFEGAGRTSTKLEFLKVYKNKKRRSPARSRSLTHLKVKKYRCILSVHLLKEEEEEEEEE